jgi:hypothetical protein
MPSNGIYLAILKVFQPYLLMSYKSHFHPAAVSIIRPTIRREIKIRAEEPIDYRLWMVS